MHGERRPILEQGGSQEPEHLQERRPEQGSEPVADESSDSTPPVKRKKRDAAFYSEIGKKGGNKTKEKHGLEHFQSLAKEGGKANAKKYGNPHFSKIGQKGGETTRERYGAEHFKEIGSEGGKKPRKKRKQTPASDET